MCSGKRKTTGEECGNVLKKVKSDTSLEHPAFYYSIHRHSIRSMNMPKLVSANFSIHCHVLMYNDTNVIMQAESDWQSFFPLSLRLNKFLQYLTEAGFRVSRTHFDPTGVRTDATLAQFKEVLTKYSVPTYSSTPQSSAVSSDRRQTLWLQILCNSLDSTEINCGYFYWRVFLFILEFSNDNLSKFWIRNNSFIWFCYDFVDVFCGLHWGFDPLKD